MRTLLRILSYLSFILSLLFILMGLSSLFERSMFGSGLMFADVEFFIILAVAFLILGLIFNYIRKKISKNFKYDY